MSDSLGFSRSAKTGFVYRGAGAAEVDAELYSDDAAKLSRGIDRVVEAMPCSGFQVVSGARVVDVRAERVSAPKLGEEQWSLQFAYSAASQRTIVKQTAIRTGTTLVIVSGSPGLVDTHITKAVAKSQGR